MHEPELDYPLARLTTVRTGGAAEHFARAGSGRELRALLRWARGRELDVHVIGSGSNLLVADAGVRGLVIKLERDLARIEPDGDGLRCGAGARMPAVAARAAVLGLAGIEFAVNIPGSVGGAVRMNANAYDGALADVLDWVEIVTVEAVTRRRPQELGFAYRSSGLAESEIVSRVRFALAPAPPEFVTLVVPAGTRGLLERSARNTLERDVLPLFAGRILSFDLDASRAYADLMAKARASGRAVGICDGFIAATAVARGLAIASRDAKPFEAAGLEVINPWDA